MRHDQPKRESRVAFPQLLGRLQGVENKERHNGDDQLEHKEAMRGWCKSRREMVLDRDGGLLPGGSNAESFRLFNFDNNSCDFMNAYRGSMIVSTVWFVILSSFSNGLAIIEGHFPSSIVNPGTSRISTSIYANHLKCFYADWLSIFTHLMREC